MTIIDPVDNKTIEVIGDGSITKYYSKGLWEIIRNEVLKEYNKI